jgi:hypothetical protein
MQDFFRLEPGFEDKAASVIEKAAKKLVKDMHYEARVQAVIKYHGQYLGDRVTKKDARTMDLTVEQYLQVKHTNGSFYLQ